MFDGVYVRNHGVMKCAITSNIYINTKDLEIRKSLFIFILIIILSLIRIS